MAALQVSRQHMALAVRQDLIPEHHKAVQVWRQMLLLIGHVACVQHSPLYSLMRVLQTRISVLMRCLQTRTMPWTMLAPDQLDTHAQG